MVITIRKGSASDAHLIQRIAYDTWPIAYRDILSKDQLDYMLTNMYSIETLELILSGNCDSLIAEQGPKNAIGFAVFTPSGDSTSIFHLNKIYVLPDFQNHHCGQLLIDAVIKSVEKSGGKKLTLNVNRFNKARYFYEKLGFTIIRQEDIDIGHGYFMNDFVMEKNLD